MLTCVGGHEVQLIGVSSDPRHLFRASGPKCFSFRSPADPCRPRVLASFEVHGVNRQQSPPLVRHQGARTSLRNTTRAFLPTELTIPPPLLCKPGDGRSTERANRISTPFAPPHRLAWPSQSMSASVFAEMGPDGTVTAAKGVPIEQDPLEEPTFEALLGGPTFWPKQAPKCASRANLPLLLQPQISAETDRQVIPGNVWKSVFRMPWVILKGNWSLILNYFGQQLVATTSVATSGSPCASPAADHALRVRSLLPPGWPWRNRIGWAFAGYLFCCFSSYFFFPS